MTRKLSTWMSVSYCSRYLVVDTRNWWLGQHVLIAPYAVTEPSWSRRLIELSVTCGQVRGSPPSGLGQEIGVTESDVFAFRNSGLEPLLFAEVGDEGNGSRLTVLSLLARLGLDPWAEAARWVTLPRNAAIACLAGNIARMPLRPQALAEAHTTATRLIQLLPVNNPVPRIAALAAPPGLAAMPKWLPMVLLYCALAIGMGVNVMMAPRSAQTAPVSTDVTVHQQP